MGRSAGSDDLESIDLDEFLGGESLGGNSLPEDISLDEFLGDGPSAGDGAGRGPEEPEPDPAARENRISDEELRTRIACYYLNEQLRDSLVHFGRIPDSPTESVIGIGFVDIADYTYISNWLSPRENQLFLNGLYTAFHEVLKKRGGYLNKISGDSMMFHFGGIIDPSLAEVAEGDALPRIARMLFDTCIDIQETCREFNRADEGFLERSTGAQSRKALGQAFAIIRNLRENLAMVSSINAMFQVRVRIGASIGEVCIGNFGPEGARQWDVVGFPVIEARRMESTAPFDGVRISGEFYRILAESGVVAEYHAAFTARAQGRYREIRADELFSNKTVVLYDKKDASFESYAVQANPGLPEDVASQVASFLEKEEDGAESALDLLKALRGNRLVIDAVDALFRAKGVELRRAAILSRLVPKRYAELVAGQERARADKKLDRKTSLFHIFMVLGKYQDAVKPPGMMSGVTPPFTHYEDYARRLEMRLRVALENQRKMRNQRLYFEQFLFPFVFSSIKGSLLEWQAKPARGDAPEGPEAGAKIKAGPPLPAKGDGPPGRGKGCK